MGYFQCMYALNAAHGNFTKLYKTVFPAGLDAHAPSSSSVSLPTKQDTLSPPPGRLCHALSLSSLASASESASSASASTSASPPLRRLCPHSRRHPSPPLRSLSSDAGAHRRRLSCLPDRPPRPASRKQKPPRPHPHPVVTHPVEGPVEEMVVAGTAFGASLAFFFLFLFLGGWGSRALGRRMRGRYPIFTTGKLDRARGGRSRQTPNHSTFSDSACASVPLSPHPRSAVTEHKRWRTSLWLGRRLDPASSTSCHGLAPPQQNSVTRVAFFSVVSFSSMFSLDSPLVFFLEMGHLLLWIGFFALTSTL
ncbi:hypothetical protein B0H12DRAFT_303059 [Mycena haematopus]|nr:hypothetical protein B0H12DRAFT_303059 [Mycena haematopus]